MNATWTLIANAGHARLLQQEAGGRLAMLHAYEHPASRLHSSELGDDKAGRELSGRGFGGAAFEPRVDAQHKEHLHFAQQLAQVLEQGAQEQRYDALELFASSPFLGELKDALGPATQRLLAGTHDVDLTSVGLAELPKRIAHAQA
jgi:protein required for attachment to host cells